MNQTSEMKLVELYLMVAGVEEVEVKHDLILVNIIFESLYMHGDSV